MGDDKLLYKDLSFKIIGTLFDVSNELGYGYQEKYYERSVAKGLKNKFIDYKRQVSHKLTFQGEKIGTYRLDFLIENIIILEIKTGKRFSKQNFDQVKAYLKATGKKLAIMAIFTSNGIRFYRVLNLNNKINQNSTELNTNKLRKNFHL
jgi:GxxExxY protein